MEEEVAFGGPDLCRLSVTLCLKPVGGLTCHSTSSFWSRLEAILLRTCWKKTNNRCGNSTQLEKIPETSFPQYLTQESSIKIETDRRDWVGGGWSCGWKVRSKIGDLARCSGGASHASRARRLGNRRGREERERT